MRNFANRTLYHGDNLAFLRGMNSGSVNMIATDPPFNKGKDFHATPDSLAAGARFEDRWAWDRDVHPDWVDTIQNDWPAAWFAIDAARLVAGEDMGAFLCWLGVRLMEMHRVLADDGSIYLHIDHTAHAYVKTLMDAIFGRRNFRNEIVWAYTGPSHSPRWFPRKHDTILNYAKSDDTPFYGQALRVPHKSGIHNDGTLFNMRDNADGPAMRQREREGKPIEDWWADIAGGGGGAYCPPGAHGLPHAEAACPVRAHHPCILERGRLGARSVRGLRYYADSGGAARPPVGRHGYLGRGIRHR